MQCSGSVITTAKVIPVGAGLYGECSKDAARGSATEDELRTIPDHEFITDFLARRSVYRAAGKVDFAIQKL